MRYNRLHKDNHFLTPTLHTQTLSQYVETLRYEDLPPEVVERAKMLLFQTVGAALAAGDTEHSRKIRAIAAQANGGDGGPTTVWGTGEHMAAVHTALVLGTLADVLAWEDCSPTGSPSACAIPCAWLAAEERHKSGRELITAIVAAYEVYQRIAMAVQPSEERWMEKGWGNLNWQIFAGVIPVAKLYGMDARKINQAIGVGCECSTLPTDYAAATFSDFTHYAYGYRARDSFMIAKAVEKGIHNQRDVLDEPRCYTGIVCGDDSANGDDETTIRSDESDLTWLTRALGSRYLILETLLRSWPADLWAQSAAGLCRGLHLTHRFSPDEIERITVDPLAGGYLCMPGAEPFSDVKAQRSLPFVIASVLADPEHGARWYTQARWNAPEIADLAKRVQPGPSPAQSVCSLYKRFQSGGYPRQQVTVRLKDGRQYQAETDRPAGHPDNPPAPDDLVRRFRAQAADMLPADSLERVIQALLALENCPDVAEISRLLCRS